MTKPKSQQFSPEVRERAVRMVQEHQGEYETQWAAIRSIAEKIGCSAEALRTWLRRVERDAGQRPGPTTDDQTRLKALERENKELRRATEILRKASAYFAQAELGRRARPPRDVVVAFVDAHREVYGVEPICRVLGIAPSTYYETKARAADPERRPARAQRDDTLRADIGRVWRDNHRRVYGARKVWRQLRREDVSVARCSVERLMRDDGLHGAVRGRRIRTTVSDIAAEQPRDLVEREFEASRPNALWVADFTYASGVPVATWRGFVYVAFVVDVFSRRIVGWRASGSMKSNLVLDALEQALYDRETDAGLVCHSDRGAQPVFPRADDPMRPIPAEMLSQWLLEAEQKAGVEKLSGSLWHAYRRKWASERMHHPIKAVAEAGGWSDVTTLITCYQQPDDEAVLAVLNEPRKRRQRGAAGVLAAAE